MSPVSGGLFLACALAAFILSVWQEFKIQRLEREQRRLETRLVSLVEATNLTVSVFFGAAGAYALAWPGVSLDELERSLPRGWTTSWRTSSLLSDGRRKFILERTEDGK